MWTVEPLNEVVEHELRRLPYDLNVRFESMMELIEAEGPASIGMPHTRPVEGKIWELRLRGRSGEGRVLYVTTRGQRVVLLHAFVKKTEKTPRRSIELAKRRMRDLK